MTQVSEPAPKQSERPLSVGVREPPSLCPNSMITKSPETTELAIVVKRPSSVYERAERPAMASLTILTPVKE